MGQAMLLKFPESKQPFRVYEDKYFKVRMNKETDRYVLYSKSSDDVVFLDEEGSNYVSMYLNSYQLKGDASNLLWLIDGYFDEQQLPPSFYEKGFI